ncbi:LysR family transcriptional regulator substrate-binding protein [Saccharopolyspora shandongensis]|uniref:LysR family transcriptional regulator substrate-binding protein n=1 Tax=Saccharopolyspora shandongensis TaxID=418495 RepID=UPI003427ED2D
MCGRPTPPSGSCRNWWQLFRPSVCSARKPAPSAASSSAACGWAPCRRRPRALIFPAKSSVLRTAFEQLLEGIEARIVYTTNNAQASQHMVRAGVGICMANTLLSSTVSGGGVALIPLPFPWAHASISAIVRKDEARTSAVQALLGLLRDSVKNLRST